MGGLLFVEFIIAFFIFPDIKDENLANDKNKTLPILPLILNLRFFLTMLMLLVGSISIGFMEPCIQLHLAPVKLYLVLKFLILILFNNFYYFFSKKKTVKFATDRIRFNFIFSFINLSYCYTNCWPFL